MSERTKDKRKLIIKNHNKNPFVKFWNWGWNIYYDDVEFWTYVIVGAFTTMIFLSIKLALSFTILKTNQKLASLIAWILAVIFAFVTNKLIVFKSKNKKILKELLYFFSARAITELIDIIITFIYSDVIHIKNKVIIFLINIGTQIIILLLNYIFSKLYIFKGDKNEG